MCLQLCEHAGKYIKKVRKEGQYHAVKAKESNDIGLNDVFTVADVSIQKTIEYNIKNLFPYMNIVSEEDEENTRDITPTI